MRTVGVVTFARSDYSSCLPLLQALRQAPALRLRLIVSGTHLLPEYGESCRQIEADGFREIERVPMSLDGDDACAIGVGVGQALAGFSRCLRQRPDLLLVVGDRVELLAPATAALLAGVPLAHVSGGDLTEGAIDNQVRHAVSKLSHLHFVAMPEHAARLRQMGEESWRITVSGDPALDLLRQVDYLDVAGLGLALGRRLSSPLIAVTFHPSHLEPMTPAEQTDELLAALQGAPGTLVLTAPNSDAQNRDIRERLERFVADRPHASLHSSLGQRLYYSLLRHADLMVGNSSSGIWEAPSFGLPVVNIGERQRGRRRAANVIDVPCQAAAIRAAVDRALDLGFRSGLRGLVNPYGDGHAAQRVVGVLERVPLGAQLLRKTFAHLPQPGLTNGSLP